MSSNPSRSEDGPKNQKTILKKVTGWTAITLFALGALYVPILVKASFFPFSPLSIISGLETYVAEEFKSRNLDWTVNSQNMLVLEPATNIDPNPAKGGGEINIIDDSALLASSGISGADVGIDSVKNAGKISLYEVREGDSISQIAQMFGVSVNTIKWANELDGPIQPGQKLVILPITGIKHTVKYGGTVADVAKIYDADVTETARLNGLAANTELKPGDEIIVPNVNPQNLDNDDNQKKGSGTAVYVKAATSNVSYSGYFTNPVPGAIVTQGLHGYNGIDFGVSLGTPVRAAASGRVINSKQSGWNGGYGNMIVISHDNGTQTLYAHLSSNAAFVGDWVTAGEIIGYSGSTGKSTGPHLHFEVRGAKNPWSVCAEGSVCR